MLEDGVIESIRNAMSRYVFKIMRNFNNINLWSSLGFKMVSKLFNFFAKGASKPILFYTTKGEKPPRVTVWFMIEPPYSAMDK